MKKQNIKTNFFKPDVPRKIINLSWLQSKARFPLMKPYNDSDKDGVKNFRDCKPFDIRRQGKRHDGDDEDISVGFDEIKKSKTIGDVQELEESVRRFKSED